MNRNLGIKRFALSILAGLLVISASLEATSRRPIQIKAGSLAVLEWGGKGAGSASAIPERAVSGAIYTLSGMVGYTDKNNVLVFPTSVISRSQVKKLHFFVDFLCTQTTKVSFYFLLMGPISGGLEPIPISVKKNTYYRQELIIEGADLKYMEIGLFDFIVGVIPDIVTSVKLVGSGGTGIVHGRVKVTS